MKVFLGISLYLLDIPVILWLYYRCLEKEKEVWRRGRYPLLVLHGAAGIFGFLNSLGIGPGGLGGTTTALAVNINTYPTHIAGLPVAVNICCHVNRHVVREI